MTDETKAKDRLAITIEGKFNQSRTVVMQTTMPLETDQKTLYKEFSRICELMDRREEFYLLKGLKITLERDEAELKSQIEKVANLEDSYRNEHISTGRKGEYELKGQQKHNVDNQKSGVQALKDRVAKIKSEIKELEGLQKVYE